MPSRDTNPTSNSQSAESAPPAVANRDPADVRVIASERVFSAPRERVWRALIDPALLAQWLGPKGFTNTFHEFDPRQGGVWRYTMFGPDGARYEQTRKVVEVVTPSRLVLDNPNPVHRFRTTMTLDADGPRTRLVWRMAFEDAAEFVRVKDIVAAANEENFDRLEAVLRDAGREQFNTKTQQQTRD